MYCFGCGYDLRGLSAGACPECGRAFDPAQPETFGDAPPRWFPGQVVAAWARRAFYIAVASPWLVLVLTHVALLLARLERGHWPNRMGGEPPEGTPLAHGGAVATAFVMIVLLVSPFLILALPWCMHAPARPRLWRLALRTTVIGAAIWIAAFVLMQHVPSGAMVWIMD